MILHAAGHDGKLIKIDMKNFEINIFGKNAHQKTFKYLGIYQDKLITISYSFSEIT